VQRSVDFTDASAASPGTAVRLPHRRGVFRHPRRGRAGAGLGARCTAGLLPIAAGHPALRRHLVLDVGAPQAGRAGDVGRGARGAGGGEGATRTHAHALTRGASTRALAGAGHSRAPALRRLRGPHWAGGRGPLRRSTASHAGKGRLSGGAFGSGGGLRVLHPRRPLFVQTEGFSPIHAHIPAEGPPSTHSAHKTHGMTATLVRIVTQVRSGPLALQHRALSSHCCRCCCRTACEGSSRASPSTSSRAP